MQLSAKEVWKRVLDEAYHQLPDKVVRAWLEPTEAVALEDGRLVVAAPDEFAAKWNETNHAGLSLGWRSHWWDGLPPLSSGFRKTGRSAPRWISS